MTGYMVEIKQQNIKTIVSADDAIEAIKKALAAAYDAATVSAVCDVWTDKTTNKWTFLVDGPSYRRIVELVPSRHAKPVSDRPREQAALLEFLDAPKLFELD